MKEMETLVLTGQMVTWNKHISLPSLKEGVMWEPHDWSGQWDVSRSERHTFWIVSLKLRATSCLLSHFHIKMAVRHLGSYRWGPPWGWQNTTIKEPELLGTETGIPILFKPFLFCVSFTTVKPVSYLHTEILCNILNDALRSSLNVTKECLW